MAGPAAAAAGDGRISAISSSSSGGGRSGSSAGTGRKRPRAGEERSSGGGDGGSNGNGGHKGIEIERLFERCLVPCASYWWLWERYALWKVRDTRCGCVYSASGPPGPFLDVRVVA